MWLVLSACADPSWCPERSITRKKNLSKTPRSDYSLLLWSWKSIWKQLKVTNLPMKCSKMREKEKTKDCDQKTHWPHFSCEIICSPLRFCLNLVVFTWTRYGASLDEGSSTLRGDCNPFSEFLLFYLCVFFPFRCFIECHTPPWFSSLGSYY